MIYNLEERTSKFGIEIIKFLKTINQNTITRPVISQLVRSATSIGANYMEANQASSKKDFYNKVRISQKESNETKHWLKMLSATCDADNDLIQKFWKEAHELTLIFAKISKSKENQEIKV